MEWTAQRFIDARDTVDTLLRALPLDAFIFEVEPRDDRWEVRVEYPTADAWRMVTLTIDDPLLTAARRDGEVRQRVLTHWKGRIAS